MLSPIITPPISISPEEHTQITSQTPESFIDIPPILRWLDDVEVLLSSKQGGWENWPTSQVNENETIRVKGKLWVNEISVAFIPSDQNIKPGFNLPFPSLTLHALTPSSNDLPAHLYCQVDESDAPPSSSTTTSITTAFDAGPSNQNGLNGEHINGDHEDIKIDQTDDNQVDEEDEEDQEDDDDDDVYGNGEDEFTEMREIRIFLDDSTKLESLFQALSFCSALHDSVLPNGEPSSFFGFGGEQDDDDEEDEDEDDGQWEDADEDPNGNGAGRVRSDFHSGGGPQARFRPY
ncbi:uncharacterized protein L201_001099 [Kwoniella dendrophila CBS 6074]|uniref:Chloride channel, nucleotide-sensitive, 1A n=1 Tax=Kwoniella dendrophila CBS 6074 TaxID=1295534 RepID=A0AAX4JMI1_9TREE